LCISIILVVVVATKDGDGEGVEGREMRWEGGRKGEGGRKIKREDVEDPTHIDDLDVLKYKCLEMVFVSIINRPYWRQRTLFRSLSDF